MSILTGLFSVDATRGRGDKTGTIFTMPTHNKKLSYCWETVRRESMPRIAEMDVEMTT